MNRQLETMIRSACLMEATARKPGNVHPGAGFSDLCYGDFVVAADAIARSLTQTVSQPLGKSILQAVQQTRLKLNQPTNPNLGMILLLAPLARVPASCPLESGVATVLENCTVQDSIDVFQAIAEANPGGMGQVKEQDLHERPTLPLRDIMRLAMDRDTIAREYSTGFSIVLHECVPFLASWPGFATNWEQCVILLQLRLMRDHPDTLIARKCGWELSVESSHRADAVLRSGAPFDEPFCLALCQFDKWLRADGHRRNPGTTADLIAASLFAAAREGMMSMPEAVEIQTQPLGGAQSTANQGSASREELA